MIECTLGLRTLDKVYLDTSFTEDIGFQPKAEGLRELIEKVLKYPKNTKFYFSSWTYGYEQVWLALAKALNSQVHVDDYKMNMYQSLRVKLADDHFVHLSPEAAALTGFPCGNGFQEGILTRDESVRLHSCERGTHCETMRGGDVVFITPIVAHLPENKDMEEVGIGGGAGDLEHKDELSLTPEDARLLLESVNSSKNLAREFKTPLVKFLLEASATPRPVTLNILATEYDASEDNPTDLQSALQYIVKATAHGRGSEPSDPPAHRISFPYSRHSSYRELCQLLHVLKPRDVWPCTVQPIRWVKEGITIQGLFGEYCKDDSFQYDKHISKLAATLDLEDSQHESQTSAESVCGERHPFPMATPEISIGAPDPTTKYHPGQATTASLPTTLPEGESRAENDEHFLNRGQVIDLTLDSNQDDGKAMLPVPGKRSFEDFAKKSFEAASPPNIQEALEDSLEEAGHLLDSQESSASAWKLEIRRDAFNTAMNPSSSGGWAGLISTTNNHAHPEEELGEAETTGTGSS